MGAILNQQDTLEQHSQISIMVHPAPKKVILLSNSQKKWQIWHSKKLIFNIYFFKFFQYE